MKVGSIYEQRDEFCFEYYYDLFVNAQGKGYDVEEPNPEGLKVYESFNKYSDQMEQYKGDHGTVEYKWVLADNASVFAQINFSRVFEEDTGQHVDHYAIEGTLVTRRPPAARHIEMMKTKAHNVAKHLEHYINTHPDQWFEVDDSDVEDFRENK